MKKIIAITLILLLAFQFSVLAGNNKNIEFEKVTNKDYNKLENENIKLQTIIELQEKRLNDFKNFQKQIIKNKKPDTLTILKWVAVGIVIDRLLVKF